MRKKEEFFNFKKLDFFGKCIESENQIYKLCWSMSERSVLFFKNEEILFSFENLFFVKSCDVSNNGYSIIAGGYDNDANSHNIIVCNEYGEIIFKTKIKSRIYNTKISDDGKYVVFQSYNSMLSEDDSGKIFLFDLSNNSEISRFQCALGWPNDYVFLENKKYLRLIYDNQSIDYDFYGNCLELDKLPKKEQNPYDIFYELENTYSDINEKTSKDLLEKFYIQYLEISKEDFTPHVAGVTFRRLGELSMKLGNINDALLFFEKADVIYPKIGVKKIIKKLKENT